MQLTSNKNILNITYPIFLTLLAQNMINVINTAFLGRVGEIELGASAIGGVFYIAVYMLGFGFSQGAQILIGRRNGEGKFDKIGPIFNIGLLFNFLVAIIIFILSSQLMPLAMTKLVNSENVYHAAVEYLDYRIYGFFFSFLNVMYRGLYVGITRTKALSISAAITATVNVIFDYLLIFGNFGFPEMGIKGAAIASVIAEGVTFIYLTLYSLKYTDTRKYQLYRFFNIKLKSILPILDLSIFIMMQYFISVSTWFIFFVLIEHMGERPLAITNIGRSLYALLIIPGAALATTTNTIVSNMIGAGQKDEVLNFVKRILRITFLISLPITLLVFLIPNVFAHIYTDDPDLMAASIPVLKVVALGVLANVVSSALFNAVSGTGNTRTGFAIECFTLVIYVSYIYYTAVINPTTPAIVWMSEFIYWIPVGLLCLLYLKKGNWQKKGI